MHPYSPQRSIAKLPLLGITFGLLVVAALSPQVSSAQPAQPGNEPTVERPQIRETRFGKTLAGGQGERLRGVVISIFQYRRDQIAKAGDKDDNLDPEYWDKLKASGVNAVRLVFFDPWQRSHGDAENDPNRPFPFLSLLPEDVVVQGGTLEQADGIIATNQAILSDELTRIADLAAARRMYLMVNYHDTFGFEDPDWESGITTNQPQFGYQAGSTRYLDAFWDLVAPILKDRRNVFFELMNEPIPYHPNDYDADSVASMAACYQRVRALAPDTHLVLGSFATTAHFGNRSMLTIARELDRSSVSFVNASIGFHPYNISELAHTTKNLSHLMKRYAIVNTEQGYPESVDDGSDDPDAGGFGRDLLGQQSMEKIHSSWFAWNTAGEEEFDANYLGIVKADAIAKRYFWGWEIAWADSLSELQQSRSDFARHLYPMLSFLFQWLTYF
jgi:hypothetical protein